MIGIDAGVGGQWTMFDAQNVSLGATTVNESSETWVFSYQGYAGVRYDISERFSLGLFYHYNVADAPSWKFDSIAAGNQAGQHPHTLGVADAGVVVLRRSRNAGTGIIK